MPYSKCKRLTVHAMGIDISGKIEYATNGNRTRCTGEVGKCGCTHAEVRLLKKMPFPNMVVVSHSPCLDCAKALHKAGVKLVSYLKEYRILDGVEYLKENGVMITHMEGCEEGATYRFDNRKVHVRRTEQYPFK